MFQETSAHTRDPAFYRPGVNAVEAARVKDRLASGETAKQISDSMMICLSCIESFCQGEAVLEAKTEPSAEDTWGEALKKKKK